MQFTPKHRTEAKALQDELHAFQKELSDDLAVVWPSKKEDYGDEDEDGELGGSDTWFDRMETAKARRKFAVEQIKMPETEKGWKFNLLEL